MDIGTTIKSIRRSKGFKQGHLANLIDITQSYMSLIEKNKKSPNLSTLQKISDSLEVPLPIIFFLSLELSDVPTEKQDAFQMIFPSIDSFVRTLFLSQHD